MELNLTNAFLLIFAPFFGSFAALLAYRWPKNLPIVVSRSRCDHCNHVLTIRDLLPLVGFILLRGRCRYCRHRISPRYFAVELFALLIVVWVLYSVPAAEAWISIGLGWALFLLGVVDLTCFRLPDFVTLPLIPSGLLATLYFQSENFYEHLIASVVGYGFIRLVDFLYLRLRKRRGIGEGDAKLFSAVGAWVGLYGLPSVLFIAAGSGLFFAVARSILTGLEENGVSGTMALPFGAFLAFGFWLVWLYGPLVVT